MKVSRDKLLQRMRNKAAKHNATTYRVVAAGVTSCGTVVNIKTNWPRLYHKGGGLHAEANVLRTSPPNVAKVYVARFGAAGDMLPIEPCKRCAKLASKLGVVIESL